VQALVVALVWRLALAVQLGRLVRRRSTWSRSARWSALASARVRFQRQQALVRRLALAVVAV